MKQQIALLGLDSRVQNMLQQQRCYYQLQQNYICIKDSNAVDKSTKIKINRKSTLYCHVTNRRRYVIYAKSSDINIWFGLSEL